MSAAAGPNRPTRSSYTRRRMGYSTEQEEFWAGTFGDEYTRRNHDSRRPCELLGDVVAHLEADRADRDGSRARLQRRPEPKGARSAPARRSVTCGRDQPRRCRGKRGPPGRRWSRIRFSSSSRRQSCDLVLIAGRSDPHRPRPSWTKSTTSCTQQPRAISVWRSTTARCPIEVPYRGHRNRLFKRDFAGEILDRYPRFESCRLRICLPPRPRVPSGRHDVVPVREAQSGDRDELALGLTYYPRQRGLRALRFLPDKYDYRGVTRQR